MAPASDVPTGSCTDAVILTPIDMVNEHTCLTTGYIVENPSLDFAASVHTAALRVADKWRLLAGRVEVDAKSKWLQIRVPHSDGDHSFQSPVHFTTASYHTSLDLDTYRVLERHNQATVIVRPPIQYFRDPSTPITLAEYVAQSAPILSIHISTLDNCVCVGVTVPHVVFDRIGLGLVLKALDCELKGLEWTPPPLDASKTLDDLCETYRGAEIEGNIPSGVSVYQSLNKWSPVVVRRFLSLAVTTIRQYLWPSRAPILRDRTIYLGPDVVSAIVKYVNDQCANSSETATTGDILWAWLLKAAHRRNTKDHGYLAVSVMSFRTTLAPINSVFANYPQNIALPSVFRIPTVATPSLHELALLHRRSLRGNRTIQYFRAWTKVAPKKGSSIWSMLQRIIRGFLFFANATEQSVWVYSNSSAAGMDQVVLDPTQLEMFFIYTSSRSDALQISQSSVRYIQTYTLRNGGTAFNVKNMDGQLDQMWDALEEELASLRNGKGPDAANKVGKRYY